MALSGTINGAVGSGGSYNSYIRYVWSATQDIANNTSTITANLYLIIGSGTSTNATETGNIYIDGSGQSYNNGTQARSAGTYWLSSYSRTISHNADGTRSFSFSGQFTSGWSYFGSLYVSGSATLDTIPRASTPTLSASSIAIGNSVTIYTNRLSSAFTHTIDFDFAPSFGTTLATGVTDSYTWNTTANANSLYAQIPNANSGVGKVWLHTYNGGTLIGSKSIDLALTVTNSNPTFTNFMYADTNATTAAVTGNNQYLVQNLSTLRGVVSAANKMVAINSATASSYTATIDGAVVSQNYSTSDLNFDMGVIAGSGTRTLGIRAYDSRGNNTLVEKSVTVLPYAAPVINATATRTNNFEAATTLVVSGTFSRLTIGSVDKNTIAASAVQYRYRQDGGTWGSWTAMTRTLGTGTFTTTNVYLTLVNTSTFDFEIKATDSLLTTTIALSVGRGAPIMFVSDSSNSVGIGKMPTVSNALDVSGDVYSGGIKVLPMIDEDDFASNSNTKVPTQQSVKAYTDGLISALAARVTTLENKAWIIGVLPASNNANNALSDGCYTFTSDTINRPTGQAYGTIFTTVSTGFTGNNTDNWVNQLAFPTSGVIMYRQKVNAGAWSAWKTISQT